VDLDIGPEVLALPDHARPPAVERRGDEARHLDRVRVLQSCVDEEPGRQAVDRGREDYVAFDVAYE
jgi:hypothetical protein